MIVNTINIIIRCSSHLEVGVGLLEVGDGMLALIDGLVHHGFLGQDTGDALVSQRGIIQKHIRTYLEHKV